MLGDTTGVAGCYLQDVCDRQGSHYRLAEFRFDKHNAPKQPDGVSCGVCVFSALELLKRDPENFYHVLENQSHWSPEYIASARARFACDLLVRPNGANNEGAEALRNFA